MKYNKELNIEDTTCCYVCGSKEKRNGCSLHIWDISVDVGYTEQ